MSQTIPAAVLEVLDGGIIVFFLVFHSIALALLVVASRVLAASSRGLSPVEADEIFANPLSPGVSMVMPVHDCEADVVASVQSLLDVHYPDLEVIVVDDGSSDDTFARLRSAFDLVRVEHVITDELPFSGSVLTTHRSRRGEPLLVVRKEHTGRRADVVNVGINAARSPLVALCEPATRIEPDALLRMVLPFLDDQARVVGVGGAVVVDDRAEASAGRNWIARWLARIQTVEHLRSFLLARVAWSRANGLLDVSGAFALFRRDIVVVAGGLDANSGDADAELIARLHHELRSLDADYRIEFVAEPVCRRINAVSARELRARRRRWSQGLTELTRSHRSMVANPRYGRVGMLVLPFIVVFELFGALVELVAVPLVLGGFAAGLVSSETVLLFVAAAWLYGLLVSVATLSVLELSDRTTTGPAMAGAHESIGRGFSRREFTLLVVAAAIETVLFRPVLALWRLEGVALGLRRTQPKEHTSELGRHGTPGLVDASWR